MVRVAAIEGGGQSWVAGIAQDTPDNIIEREVFVTEDPETTLSKIRAWLSQRTFDSIGIACFGPVDARPSSPTFGFITSTPKAFWKNTDVLKLLGLKDEFKNIPFRFDTDVNAPAYAEFCLHRQPGTTSCAYITVGTGVGVGLVINSSTTLGLMHPEAGHIKVLKYHDDKFEGTCPFHGCCIEGMCSSGAIAARKGCSPKELPELSDEDEVWDIFSYYIGSLCANLILIASPERITIGGGVMNRECLFGKIRMFTASILNGYIKNDRITTDKINTYIGPSAW